MNNGRTRRTGAVVRYHGVVPTEIDSNSLPTFKVYECTRTRRWSASARRDVAHPVTLWVLRCGPAICGWRRPEWSRRACTDGAMAWQGCLSRTLWSTCPVAAGTDEGPLPVATAHERRCDRRARPADSSCDRRAPHPARALDREDATRSSWRFRARLRLSSMATGAVVRRCLRGDAAGSARLGWLSLTWTIRSLPVSRAVSISLVLLSC